MLTKQLSIDFSLMKSAFMLEENSSNDSSILIELIEDKFIKSNRT